MPRTAVMPAPADRTLSDRRGSAGTPSRRGPANAFDATAVQLKQLARAYEGKPIAAFIDAVVEWHMDSLFAYSHPGLAGEDESFPQDTVESMNRRNLKIVVEQLTAEITDLRLKMLTAVACVHNYSADPIRNAPGAKAKLRKLLEELSRPNHLGIRAKAS